MNASEQITDLSEVSWISDLMVERLSASGDTTGIPYYHYRWKKKWLADYVAWPQTRCSGHYEILFKTSNPSDTKRRRYMLLWISKSNERRHSH
jgi:hypothetical protein